MELNNEKGEGIPSVVCIWGRGDYIGRGGLELSSQEVRIFEILFHGCVYQKEDKILKKNSRKSELI